MDFEWIWDGVSSCRAPGTKTENNLRYRSGEDQRHRAGERFQQGHKEDVRTGSY